MASLLALKKRGSATLMRQRQTLLFRSRLFCSLLCLLHLLSISVKDFWVDVGHETAAEDHAALCSTVSLCSGHWLCTIVFCCSLCPLVLTVFLCEDIQACGRKVAPHGMSLNPETVKRFYTTPQRNSSVVFSIAVAIELV